MHKEYSNSIALPSIRKALSSMYILSKNSILESARSLYLHLYIRYKFRFLFNLRKNALLSIFVLTVTQSAIKEHQ